MIAFLGRIRMLQPLAARDFRLLWCAMTVSLIGDGIYVVAIAWQVYELSNAPTALGIVGVAWTLPTVLFVLVGGAFSDRFDRRTLMLVSDLVRAAAIGSIGVLSVTGALELWMVLILVAIYGAGDALFVPAFQSIVPDLVAAEHLMQANSIDMLMRPLAMQLVGPAIGGLAIAVVGTGAAFLLDAGTFLVSASFLLMIPRRPLPPRGATSVRSVFQDIREGFQFVRSLTWLWGSLVAAAFSLLFFFGPSQVLLPFVVKNELGGTAGDFGLALAAAGVGSIAGALFMGGRSLPRRFITVMYAFWTAAVVCVGLWGLATGLWQIMLISVFRGFAITVGIVIWVTMIHTRVPRELLGRVASFDWMLSLALIPVSFALVGPIAEALGARETLVLAGGVGAAITLAFLFLPGMRATERTEPAYDPAREGAGAEF
jgi:MFS family permease